MSVTLSWAGENNYHQAPIIFDFHKTKRPNKMIASNLQLTVIVPVYNEEECLWKFQENMDGLLSQTELAVKVLFVNDGSTDGSFNIIKQICRKDARYQALCLARNYGLSTALKAGIDSCGTDLVGYMDADLQTTAEDLITLLPFFPEYDMVLGIRQRRKDSAIKKISSKIANAVRQKVLKDGIEDTGCPLKIMKREYAQKIPFFNGMHRFLPALVQFMGGKVKQVPVRHFPRYGGQPKYHLGNRLIGPFLDMLAVLWMKSRFCQYEIKK